MGFGDQDPGGAVANSGSEGDHNNALAVSTGFSPVGAIAVAQGERNNVVSIDGVGVTGPYTERNNVMTVAGFTTLAGDAHDNTVVNVLGNVHQTKAQGEEAGILSLSVCGTNLGAQADHITVSEGCVSAE